MELVQNMSISEGLDGRHIDVIASNEADRKGEANQLEVPLIISNRSMLLERSKSRPDGNTGEESKFGIIKWSSVFRCEKETSCWEHRLWNSSRRCSQQKKKLTEKIKGFQLDELERKQSNLNRKMTRKTKTVGDILYSFKNTEQLQQFDDIFRMMLHVQKSYHSSLPPAKQQRDEEWFDDLDKNICSFNQRIHCWIKDTETES